MSSIIKHEALAGVDLRDEKLVERAVVDLSIALLDLIRPMDAPQALRTVVSMIEAIERRGRS